MMPYRILQRITEYSNDDVRYVLGQIDNRDAFERAATNRAVTALELESLNKNLTLCGVPTGIPASEIEVRCACKALHERERELR